MIKKSTLIIALLLYSITLNNIGASITYSKPIRIELSEEQKFNIKLINISDSLDIKSEWLIDLINHESKFNSKAKNPISGAVGLTQFLPNTLKQFNIKSNDYLNKSKTEQLTYIYMYFIKNKIYINNRSDLFICNFMPTLLFIKNPNFIISKYPHKIYNQNFILDLNRDGIIRKYEVIKYFSKII